MEGMSAISGSIEEERGTNGRSKKDRKGKKGTRWGKEINRRCKRGFAKRERVTNPFSFRNSIKQYNVPDILSTLPSSFSFYYRMVSSISRSSTVLLWVKAEILENAWERTSLLRLDIDWKITYFLTYFHTLCAHMRRPTHKNVRPDIRACGSMTDAKEWVSGRWVFLLADTAKSLWRSAKYLQ